MGDACAGESWIDGLLPTSSWPNNCTLPGATGLVAGVLGNTMHDFCVASGSGGATGCGTDVVYLPNDRDLDLAY